jgi:hypothetical protein
VEFPLNCGMYGFYIISSPILCSNNTTLIFVSPRWNKIKFKIMEPLLLLVAQYLTNPNSRIGVGF